MPITILAVADQISPLLYDHFQAERWKSVDLIVSCGDLPPDYLDFLVSTMRVPLLYVRGNHDRSFSDSDYAGFENLHGHIMTCHGIQFAGFEGSRRYNGEGCQYTEIEMRRAYRRLRMHTLWRDGPRILVSHAPPAGIHDGDDMAHQGFEVFRTAMRHWRPTFLLHGHTHAYDRRETLTVVDGTTVINVYPYRLIEVPEYSLG